MRIWARTVRRFGKARIKASCARSILSSKKGGSIRKPIDSNPMIASFQQQRGEAQSEAKERPIASQPVPLIFHIEDSYYNKMIENKKSGIRLRHLQQGAEEPKKRDVSPGNPNRKKIFDYNNRKTNQRQFQEEREPRRMRVEENSSDYEELIDNLKKKTMEVELRDEAIKYLNKQI